MSREECVAKVRAAAGARLDPDFVLIARTDARAVAGLDEAVERVNAALAADADVAFVEAIPDLAELADVPRRVHGPCLLNVVRGGKTPEVNLRDAEAMGYRIAILPSLLLGAAMDVFDAALATLTATHQPPVLGSGLKVGDRFRRFKSEEWDALRTRFRNLHEGVVPSEAADLKVSCIGPALPRALRSWLIVPERWQRDRRAVLVQDVVSALRPPCVLQNNIVWFIPY